jgi:hypothetical protein
MASTNLRVATLFDFMALKILKLNSSFTTLPLFLVLVLANLLKSMDGQTLLVVSYAFLVSTLYIYR